MTRIDFHTGVPDAINYACRLLKKAYASGAAVAVTGDEAWLVELDAALWTFDATGFLAHHFYQEGSLQATPDMAFKPVQLAISVPDSLQASVLVNFSNSTTPPDGFERFERLIEIASLGEDLKPARVRYKYYKDRGYPLTQHVAK